MRHVKVTHTYVLSVKEDEIEALDAAANAGVTVMETIMKSAAKNIRELRSDWQLMPKEYTVAAMIGEEDDVTTSRGQALAPYYSELTEAERMRDREEAKAAIEADTDRGISFTEDVMGQRPGIDHPWDAGLSIFPPDHPLADTERRLRTEREGREDS